VQRFRGGLVFKAHRLCASLNSRLESNKEEEEASGSKRKASIAASKLGFPPPPTWYMASRSPLHIRHQANSAHVGQSRPDVGLGFQVKVLKLFPLRSAAETLNPHPKHQTQAGMGRRAWDPVVDLRLWLSGAVDLCETRSRCAWQTQTPNTKRRIGWSQGPRGGGGFLLARYPCTDQILFFLPTPQPKRRSGRVEAQGIHRGEQSHRRQRQQASRVLGVSP